MRYSQLRLLFNVWLMSVVTVLFSSQVEARETYRAFAARIVAQAESEGDVRADLEDHLFRLTNSFRKSQGMKALARDTSPSVKLAARAHAMDLLLHHTMGHVASTGHDLEERMRAMTNSPMILPITGENAAAWNGKGAVDTGRASALFQLWVKSAGHRHNLLGRDYVKVSIGVVVRGDKFYADQIFTGPSVVTNMQNAAPVEEGEGLY
jgi:uncharacterized protein YkwD